MLLGVLVLFLLLMYKFIVFATKVILKSVMSVMTVTSVVRVIGSAFVV